jgi:hypothetical protein
VGGATVCAYKLASAGKGDRLACTTTQADGSYVLTPGYAGPVVIEASGGTYMDDASGTPGVALSEPPQTVGTLGSGSNTLVATPLTALAYHRALAGGAISLGSFRASALEVAAAFSLDQVDLVRTVPQVGSTTDQYGSVLTGLSRMLTRGATLTSLVHNADLAGLKAGYQAASTSTCVPQGGDSQPQQPSLPVPGTSGSVVLTGVALPGGRLEFSAYRPFPGWRSLLPLEGTVMGCQVLADTPATVRLSCPISAWPPH